MVLAHPPVHSEEMTNEEIAVAAEKYVEAKISGSNGAEARKISGYAPSTSVHHIEKPGGPVDTLMAQRLKEKGINEAFLADKYLEGLSIAYSPGAKDKDVNGAAQLLRQLAHLLGYGRKETPSVAVQINNGASSPGNEPTATRELIAEIAGLAEILKSQVGKDQQLGVHEGDIGTSDADAYTGMAEHPGETPDAGGRGGA